MSAPDRFQVHQWAGSDPDQCIVCDVEWSDADLTCTPTLSPEEQAMYDRFEAAAPAPESYNPGRLYTTHDFSAYVNARGNIQVELFVGRDHRTRQFANMEPFRAARWLRELADDIEAAS